MLHSFRTESKQQNMLFIKKMNKAHKNYEIILCIPGGKKKAFLWQNHIKCYKQCQLGAALLCGLLYKVHKRPLAPRVC